MKTKSLVRQFCTNNIKLILSLCFFSILTIVFTVGLPFVIKFMIDQVQAGVIAKGRYDVTGLEEYIETFNTAKNSFAILVIIFAASLVCILLFNSFRLKDSRKFGNELTKSLKHDVYSIVIHSDISELKKFDNEDIKSRIIDGSERIGNVYYGKHIVPLLYALIAAIAALAVTFSFDATAGLICLICIPVLYLAISSIEKIRQKRIAEYNNNLEKEVEIIDYSFKNIKNIKIRNGLNKEEDSYKGLVNKLHKNYDSVHTVNSMSKNFSFMLLLNLSIIIIAGLIAYTFYSLRIDNVDTTFEIGSSISVFATVTLFLYNLRDVLIIYLDKQSIDLTYEKIDELLELKQENRSESINSIDDIFSLKFTNVSYQDNTKNGLSINNVNFEIKKGEKLGILGLNNSGKSLIADLATKLIRPTSGSISINNCDLMKINTYYLRDIVTYVPQDLNLLDDTVEANIIYPFTLDEYKYNEALNKCGLKDLLFNLEDRDQTNIKKVKISDSDKQKIALANAIYKDSPIIVLEEATNKLDPISEEKIMGEFLKLKNKIIITACSHINVVVKCDKVLLVSNGQVLEYGKTDELLQNKKSFLYQMYNNVGSKKNAM